MKKCNFDASAAAFSQEADVTPVQDAQPTSVLTKDLLEKKWTSVVRLKKQVMDLEKHIKQLQQNTVCERCDAFADLAGAAKSKGGAPADCLPREPAKYTLAGHRAKVTKVALHPFYSLAASASEDASIRLWDYEQGEHERTLKSHAGIVTFLAFSPDGQTLASSSTDLSIKLWSMQSFTVVKTLLGHEHEVSGLAFLPQGQGDLLLSCSRDQSIRLWDTLSGTSLCSLTDGHSDWVRRVAVHPSGHLFASASKDETIVVWNCDAVRKQAAAASANREDPVLQILSGHEHVIDCIAWAHAEAAKVIASADYSGGGAGMSAEAGLTGDTLVNGTDEESK